MKGDKGEMRIGVPIIVTSMFTQHRFMRQCFSIAFLYSKYQQIPNSLFKKHRGNISCSVNRMLKMRKWFAGYIRDK